MSTFGKRLKEARLRAGLSGEALGVCIGVDETAAATRISRYETGDRAPAHGIAALLADALNVPVAFLYCDDDGMARLLLSFAELRARDRARAVDFVEGLTRTRPR
ncbi:MULTISPECIES: helix-turn-helix transcriptional regulator [Burkholderia]|uniref:helix-turn-helix transcriptional regulator n=1 Tax=Burkholderia TaxID=32008 RepID=UPI001641ADBA|nr:MULTISPECIES: helix-turn-helix transcriptional regulator [Burkholderia]